MTSLLEAYLVDKHPSWRGFAATFDVVTGYCRSTILWRWLPWQLAPVTEDVADNWCSWCSRNNCERKVSWFRWLDILSLSNLKGWIARNLKCLESNNYLQTLWKNECFFDRLETEFKSVRLLTYVYQEFPSKCWTHHLRSNICILKETCALRFKVNENSW